MSDRRQLEAAIHRQLTMAWSAAATAARVPLADDPVEIAVRAGARQRVIDDAVFEILRAIERKER